jgi:hypothetical protein
MFHSTLEGVVVYRKVVSVAVESERVGTCWSLPPYSFAFDTSKIYKPNNMTFFADGLSSISVVMT